MHSPSPWSLPVPRAGRRDTNARAVITIRGLRRSWPLIALLALATFAATALAAAPRSGWEIRRTVSRGPLAGFQTAKHCGAGRFGIYTIHANEKYKGGHLKGKTVRVVVRVALRDDRRRHRFHFVSVGGTAITGLPPAVRHKLEHALAARYAKYSFQVVDFLYGLRLKTRLWMDEKILATGYIDLRKVRC